MNDLAALHREWLMFEQQYRYSPKYSKEVESHYLKHLVRLLRVRGYTVLRMASNAHWDLTLARGGHTVRIEVKISRPRRKTRRFDEYYQFKLKSGGRRSPDGDVVICCCCPNGPASMVPFIIPVKELEGRATLEISSAPDRYAGQWVAWRGAWDVLEEFPQEPLDCGSAGAVNSKEGKP